jgi:hypothetical protein
MPPRRSGKREPDPGEKRPDPRRPGTAGTAAVRELKGSMYVDTEKGQFLDRSTPLRPTLGRRQFETEYARLLRAFGDGQENLGSFSCQGCRSCAGCMFCVDCEACHRCTHCTGCRDCAHLTHCQDCTGCYDSAYCVRCESCTGSSYLVLCRSCADCTYCIGCVGLVRKDFHILNVQYSRTEYFRIVKSLREEMGL